MADLSEECHKVRSELLHVHEDDHRNSSVGQHGRLFHVAIQSVPVTLLVVATVIAVAVGVMFLAVRVVNRVAGAQTFHAVVPVEQALRVVADHVALPVPEHVPTVDGGGAVAPRVDPQRAVVAVVVTLVRVALLVAVAVARLLPTPIHQALLPLPLLDLRDAVGRRTLGDALVVGPADAGAEVLVVGVAVLAAPRRGTVADVVAQTVLTDAVVLARIADALVVRVELAVGAVGSRRTFAAVAAPVLVATRPAVQARV